MGIAEEAGAANVVLGEFDGDGRDVEAAEAIDTAGAVGACTAAAQSAEGRTSEAAVDVLQVGLDAEKLADVGHERIIALAGEDFHVALGEGRIGAALSRRRPVDDRVLNAVTFGARRAENFDPLTRRACGGRNGLERGLDDQIVVSVLIVGEFELVEKLVGETVAGRFGGNGEGIYVHDENELGLIVGIEKGKGVRDVTFGIGVGGGGIAMVGSLDEVVRARSIEDTGEQKHRDNRESGDAPRGSARVGFGTCSVHSSFSFMSVRRHAEAGRDSPGKYKLGVFMNGSRVKARLPPTSQAFYPFGTVYCIERMGRVKRFRVKFRGAGQYSRPSSTG